MIVTVGTFFLQISRIYGSIINVIIKFYFQKFVFLFFSFRTKRRCWCQLMERKEMTP